MTFWKRAGAGRCSDTLKWGCKVWGDRLQGLLSYGEATARRDMWGRTQSMGYPGLPGKGRTAADPRKPR